MKQEHINQNVGGNLDLQSARARKYVPLRSFESAGGAPPSTTLETINDENKVPQSQMPRVNHIEATNDENEALKRMHK